MDFLAGVRRGGRPTIGCPIGRAGPATAELPTRFLSVLSVQSVVEFYLARIHPPSAKGSYGVAGGCFSSQSFWKAGSERKGSQSGSSLRRAGVIDVGLYTSLIGRL